MRSVPGKVGLIYITFIVFFSCSEVNRDRTNLYAIESLLQEQSEFLSDNSSKLTKITSLGDNHDTVTISPESSTEWKKELEIFGVIDVINKPANRALYKITSLSDNKSNLSIKAFTALEALPVEYLRVFYQETEERIRKIDAKYSESNLLYGSTRLLTMEFQQMDNIILLTSYKIVGDQKMFLGDSVKYTISGAVTLSD